MKILAQIVDASLTSHSAFCSLRPRYVQKLEVNRLILTAMLTVTGSLLFIPMSAHASYQSVKSQPSQSNYHSNYQTYVIHTYGGADLIPAVRQQLSGMGGGSVSAYQDKLVLRATPQGYQAVQQLLAQIDQAPQSISVSVRVGHTAQQSGSIQQGRIIISTDNNRYPLNKNNRVNIGAYGAISNQNQTQQNNSLYQVNTLSGSPATIGTNTLLSLAQTYIATTYNRYGQPTGIISINGQTLASSAKSITVTPKILPNNQVQVSISQVDSSLSNSKIAPIHSQNVATTLTLPRGQWMSVGTVSQTEQRYSSGSQGSQTSSSQTSYPIQIKVE